MQLRKKNLDPKDSKVNGLKINSKKSLAPVSSKPVHGGSFCDSQKDVDKSNVIKSKLRLHRPGKMLSNNLKKPSTKQHCEIKNSEEVSLEESVSKRSLPERTLRSTRSTNQHSSKTLTKSRIKINKKLSETDNVKCGVVGSTRRSAAISKKVAVSKSEAKNAHKSRNNACQSKKPKSPNRSIKSKTEADQNPEQSQCTSTENPENLIQKVSKSQLINCDTSDKSSTARENKGKKEVDNLPKLTLSSDSPIRSGALWRKSNKSNSVLWKPVERRASRQSGRIRMIKNKDVYELDLSISPQKEGTKISRKVRPRKPKNIKGVPTKFKTKILTTDPSFQNPYSISTTKFYSKIDDNMDTHDDDGGYEASVSMASETGSCYGVPAFKKSSQDIDTPTPLNKFVGPTSTPRNETVQPIEFDSPLEEINMIFSSQQTSSEQSMEQSKCNPSRFELHVQKPFSVKNKNPNICKPVNKKTKPYSEGTVFNESVIFDDEALKSPKKLSPRKSPLKVNKNVQNIVDPECSFSEASKVRVYTPKYKPVSKQKKVKRVKKGKKEIKPEPNKENYVNNTKIDKVLEDWASDLNSHFSEIEDTALVVE